MEETEQLLRELAEISYNLRYYSKIWKEHYGALNRRKMVEWEIKMDKWLEKNVHFKV